MMDRSSRSEATLPANSSSDISSRHAGHDTALPEIAASAAKGSSSARIRRRNRMITSCLECRRRKLKCDRLHPCTNCSKSKRDCLFLAPAMDSESRLKLTEIKEKMGRLERSLHQDVAGSPGGAETTPKHNPLFGSAEESSLPIPDYEKDLEPTPLAVQDAAYEDEADDEIYDLGFKVGKMRMTDRVGGFFRPKLADELSASLQDLNLNAKSEPLEPFLRPRLQDLLPEDRDTYFNPGPSYIAPRSDLFFGSSNRDYALMDYLPSKTVADRLMQQYWEAVYPVARIVHHPSFEKRYRIFWDDISRGFEPTPSLQSVFFAALFTAVVSMPEHEVLRLFGVSQKDLTDDFQSGTEAALRKAHFLRMTKTETMQAFVMYLLPMCRSEISRSHSALVGTAIRLAECMGFHRDPSEYGHGLVETHVRRLIWYQLCFLDIRTSEVQGPRACIRREDYSTKFPLNLDDEDLSSGQSEDAVRWTDMTFSRIRFECQEMTRICLVDRLHLEKRSISITHVLGKIESFRKAMYAKYEPLFKVPNQKPIQRAAEHMLGLLVGRLYIAVLHRYHSTGIPDRLRQIILTAGIQHLENAIQLDTAPDLRPWVWYSRAYDQYHVALILLMDVYKLPMLRDADRIWRCLDYVYEVPSSALGFAVDATKGISRKELMAHRSEKARLIITQIRDRGRVYRKMRRMKTPTGMTETFWSIALRPGAPDTNDVTLVGTSFESQERGAQMEDANRSSLRPATAAFQADVSRNSGQQLPALSTPSESQDSSFPSIFLPSYSSVQKALQNVAQARFQDANSASQTTSPSGYHQYNPNLTYPAAPAMQPSIPTSSSTGRAVRGEGLESEATKSSYSDTGGLWFMPGVTDASAGVAPTLSPLGMSSGQEDLPMLDIDWNEWDKLFPPHINNGDLNLPPQSLDATTIDVDSTLYFENYPYASTSSQNPFQ